MGDQTIPDFQITRGEAFGDLVEVLPNLFWQWGTVRFKGFMRFPRNMVLIKNGNELTVIHGIQLNEAGQKRIDALGTVKHMIRLGAFHGMDDEFYAKRYSPTVWAPPGIEQKAGVKTDVELVPGVELPIPGAELFAFEASKTPETAIVWPEHGGVLFTCDSVQNWSDYTGCNLVGKILCPLIGFRGAAMIGLGWRKISEPKDGPGFKPAFQSLLQKDFQHLIGGHGVPNLNTAKTDLQKQVDKVYG